MLVIVLLSRIREEPFHAALVAGSQLELFVHRADCFG
jgi:hypothetical protein